MRGVRVRELLLIVAMVALGLGWWLDRARMEYLAIVRETHYRQALAMRRIEADHRARAEAVAHDLRRRLVECEGRDQ